MRVRLSQGRMRYLRPCVYLAVAGVGALFIAGAVRTAWAQDSSQSAPAIDSPPPLQLKRPEWQVSLGTGISFALTSNLHIVQRATGNANRRAYGANIPSI